MQNVFEFARGHVKTFAPDFKRRDLLFTRSRFPEQANQEMSGVESRRDLFEEVGEVTVNVTAEEFIHIETLAIEIRDQRRVFLARCLQKDVDEKRAAGELLDQQITRDLARRYLLAARDVFDEFRGFGCFELFETQCVE
jgi:hypothetical protein